MHQVIWTSRVLQFFIEKANLNTTEQWIMRNRVKGMPRSVMKRELNISMATLDRYIKKIKVVYDVVQQEYPDVLPIRKDSVQQTYMDTH